MLCLAAEVPSPDTSEEIEAFSTAPSDDTTSAAPPPTGKEVPPPPPPRVNVEPTVGPNTRNLEPRIDNLEALLTVSQGSALEQSTYLQMCPPSNVRRAFEKLSDEQEQYVDAQISMLVMARDANRLHQQSQYKSKFKKMAALVTEEQKKTLEARRLVKEFDGRLSATNIALKAAESATAAVTSEKAEVCAKLEAAQTEIAKLKQQLADSASQVSELTAAGEGARQEFETLKAGIPQIVDNALSSNTVKSHFGALLEAMRINERTKFWSLVTKSLDVPYPPPQAITDQVADDSADRLKSASVALQEMKISTLVDLCKDPNASAAKIVGAKL